MASILSTIQLETTSTSGTLTSEQLATLQESKTNYIVYGTELFKLVDNNTSGDTLIYTCSTNDSGTLKVKSITVTISTLAWTYSELSSGGSSGTKKYQHNLWMNYSISSGQIYINLQLITEDNDDYTDSSKVANFLYLNGHTSSGAPRYTNVSGASNITDNDGVVCGIYSTDGSQLTVILNNFSDVKVYTLNASTDFEADNIIEI